MCPTRFYTADRPRARPEAKLFRHSPQARPRHLSSGVGQTLPTSMRADKTFPHGSFGDCSRLERSILSGFSSASTIPLWTDTWGSFTVGFSQEIVLALKPSHFQVNEAWIAFKLNDAPVSTEADGDFNVIALMDAAGCFILSTEFVRANSAELSQLESERLLKGGKSHTNSRKTRCTRSLLYRTSGEVENETG